MYVNLGSASVKMIIGLSSAALLMQVTGGNNPPGGWLGPAKDFTLDGALIVAVGVLWKSLNAANNRSLKSAELVTQALQANIDSAKELRQVVTDSVNAKRELTVAIDRLRDAVGELPCTGKGEIGPRRIT